MEIQGKGVFLTGGARGIGRAITEALLAKGAKVLFCDIDEETGTITEAELQKQYDAEHVIFQQCDVTIAERLQATFQAAVDLFGAVDICVNNAGILDERIWEKMIAINTTAQIRGSQVALEHMRRDRGGRGGVIINIASLVGLVASYWHPVYVASKHAMVGFAQSWATNPRTKEMGVRWGCLCPGPVNTDLLVPEEGQVEDVDTFRSSVDQLKIPASEAADAFMQMLQDEGSNGGLMTVADPAWAMGGRAYKKRQIVDNDGVSNPTLVDAFLKTQEGKEPQ